MVKNLISEIKKQLKEHKIFIINFLILLFLFTFQLPYTISKTGGIIDLSSRIKSENDYEEAGSLNMAYVSEVPATIPNIVISYFNSNWDLEKQQSKTETTEEMNFRGKMSLKESINNAFKVAYNYANMSYFEENKEIYITYIYEDAITDLEVGDSIKEINGQKVSSKNDLSQIISSLKVNEEVQIKVVNNKKEINRKATIIEYENKNIVGILTAEISDLTLDPEITIEFKSSEYGASGGLMMSLAIYDNLTGEDLTKGRKIAGTGTIDENGTVGEIDGIKYKLSGAVKAKADIFLTPTGRNYEEALEEKEKNNYDIIIVPISTFEEALTYLKK